MAVQIETQGQLREFLEILARRKWQVLLPAVLVIALGSAFAVIVPKKYVANTRIELRPVGVSISNKEGANAQIQVPANSRIKKVIQDLQNAEYLGLQPDDQTEFILRTQKNITVKVNTSNSQGPTPGATFVDIEYADVQKEWSARFLRALRDDWIGDVIVRDRKKAEDEESRLREEKAKIEKEYLRQEQLLTDLLRAHSLSAVQPAPGTPNQGNEDPAFARLQQNETERRVLERDIEALRVRIDSLEKQYAELPPGLPRTELVKAVTNEEELQKAEKDILDTQEQLKGLKPAASRYKLLKDREEAQTRARDQLKHLVTKGQLQESSVPNPELAERRKIIDAFKVDYESMKSKLASVIAAIDVDQSRVEELHDVYREVRERRETIARLQLDLTGADTSYNEKVRQARLLASPEADPFEITQEVVVPPKPSEPNPWLIVSFSIVAGLGVGVALAMMLEYSRNCFRTVADISRVMVVPVLGTIDTIITRRQKRLASARRILVGVSSVVVIGAILFITWAWANNAQLLSQDVRDAIESLRTKLR